MLLGLSPIWSLGQAKEYFDEAEAYRAKGNYKLAVQYYNKANAVASDNDWLTAATHCGLGLVHSSRKDEWQAIAEFGRAISIYPTKAEFYAYRARSRLRLNYLTDAKNDCERALKLEPNNWSAQYILGLTLYEMSDLTSAIKHLTIAIEERPEIAELYSKRANCKARIGDQYGAFSDYTRIVEIGDKDYLGEAYYKRGHLYVLWNEKTKGCVEFSKAGEQGVKEAYEAIRRLCY